MGLAEAGGGGEVDAGRGGQGKGERAVRRRGRVRVCAVLETWAQGIPRHSKTGSGGIEGDKSLDPHLGILEEGFYEIGERLGGVTTEQSSPYTCVVLASGIFDKHS